MAVRNYGKCKLCGVDSILTYEHVPPRNAYNKNRFYVFNQEIAGHDPFLEKSKGKQVQGGVGYYSLCESCNNRTGSWYGKAYIEFTNQAVYRLRLADAQYPNGDPFIIHPLKVIKQIVSFFISIGAINYAEHYPDLTQFVLEKGQNKLPDNYQIFMYYNDSTHYRYMADNVSYENGVIQNFSEIAHFPFGFILSFKITGVPIHNDLVEITSWKNYPYEKKARVLSIPIKKLDIEIASYPGDYRNRKEIEYCIEVSNAINSVNHFDNT